MKLARTAAAVEYFLQVLDEFGVPAGKIPVSGLKTVGRGSPYFVPDIVIPAGCRSASREHAKIEVAGDKPVLTDKSSYGTTVNGRRIEQSSVELHDGDEIIFGLEASGWRVRFHESCAGITYPPQDPLESLAVYEVPRKVCIGLLVIEEHLGGPAFQLLKFLVENKGRWYQKPNLASIIWPDPDDSPIDAEPLLSHYKKAINELLKPYLKGQDAIISRPYKGYRMKPRLEDMQ